MDLEKIIKTRRSIRKYVDKPIEDWKILKILEAGIWAPSAGNVQPWRFYVIKNPEIKHKLFQASYNQPQVLEANVLIVVCVDLEEEYKHYGNRGIELYCIQDSAAAIQNMLLMAHYLGIGSCWIGAFDEEFVKTILNLPKNYRPVAIITLGYPNEKPESWRKNLKDVVTFIE